MSGHNDGSHYDNHRQAAEIHDKAAHMHLAASASRDHQDHATGHEDTRRALEHSHQAFQRTEIAHQTAVQPHRLQDSDISLMAYELWVARGCPEGTPEHDWELAKERLREIKAGVIL